MGESFGPCRASTQRVIMSDLDTADELIAAIGKSIMVDNADDTDAKMFNKGVEAMMECLVSSLEAKGFRIVHTEALDTLVAIISRMNKMNGKEKG